MQREVERNPKVPELNPKAITLLTELCFRPEQPLTEANLLFVFSSASAVDLLAEKVREVLTRGLVPEVFITGGAPQFTDYASPGKPESELFFEQLDPSEFPGVRFFSESVSTDTRSNVTEALKVLDFSGYKKVMYIFKAHAAGRGYLTLKKFLPHTELVSVPFAPVYPEIGRAITSKDWHETEFGRSRVWGEFLRIEKYGERGDIFFNVEVKGLVGNIERLLVL